MPRVRIDVNYFIRIREVPSEFLVRVSGYRSRGPGFDSRPYQFF
jgi:hypothetical protein